MRPKSAAEVFDRNAVALHPTVYLHASLAQFASDRCDVALMTH